MAKLLTCYGTDGTPNTEMVPDINDFMFVYLPSDLIGKIPDYATLRDKFINLEAVISLQEAVDWLNGRVDDIFPLYYGGLDYWLAQKTDWWGKTPEALRKAFVSTWLPFIRVIPEPETAKDVYGFPISDILDVLAEAGAVHLLSIPTEQVVEPDAERTLKYVESLFPSPEAVQETDPSGAHPEHGTSGPASCSGEVCVPPREGPDGPTTSGGDDSCCGGGCCGS
jgi:hypothetical protein